LQQAGDMEEPTRQLFDRLENQEIVFVVSDLLDLELTYAPEKVKQFLHRYSPENFERINLTQEAIELANTYSDKNKPSGQHGIASN
jgi:hypothetical protein